MEDFLNFAIGVIFDINTYIGMAIAYFFGGFVSRTAKGLSGWLKGLV